MRIRTYKPGDEQAQVRIYNTAAAPFPAFKPAAPEEVARRLLAGDVDPGSSFYAVDGEEVVGYAVFCGNGRVSYPWCLPGSEGVRESLMSSVLGEMARRGMPEAWSAYRSDWSEVLEFFRRHDFHEKREMINYLADASWMPGGRDLPDDRILEPLGRDEVGRLAAMAPRLFASMEPHSLEAFFWENPRYDFAESLFALRERPTGQLLGASLLVLSDQFADPSKVDAAMPCFRFGAFGTERERHKRINGLFSCVFLEEAEGELLLAAPDWSRARRSGLTHVAAQAPSDSPALCAFYDHHFRRQGGFPILVRPVG